MSNTRDLADSANNNLDSISVDASGNVTANRLSTDGSIVTLQKDGTTVGNIGVGAGGQSVYFGQGDTNLLPLDSQDSILPRGTEGASRDGAISLGSGTNRFYNLYLSGGVYLGGTGSANYLDDYEEGTWTPAFATTGLGWDSITYSTQSGTYTKTGNLVTCHGYIQVSAFTLGSPSGYVKITGLPFSCTNTFEHCGSIGYGSNTFGGRYPQAIQIANGSDYAYMYYTTSVTAPVSNGLASTHMSTGSFYFMISYETSS